MGTIPVWKPAPGNDGLSQVRIQEWNGNLVDCVPFDWSPMDTASHVILSELSN